MFDTPPATAEQQYAGHIRQLHWGITSCWNFIFSPYQYDQPEAGAITYLETRPRASSKGFKSIPRDGIHEIQRLSRKTYFLYKLTVIISSTPTWSSSSHLVWQLITKIDDKKKQENT